MVPRTMVPRRRSVGLCMHAQPYAHGSAFVGDDADHVSPEELGVREWASFGDAASGWRAASAVCASRCCVVDSVSRFNSSLRFTSSSRRISRK
mmetsp:Transcript_40115/g.99138  ORF Transcript_40115/g.99138 Transcript_40115/m.99138 type:complete len:93 (+) Transcript_40115:187-465(+)